MNETLSSNKLPPMAVPAAEASLPPSGETPPNSAAFWIQSLYGDLRALAASFFVHQQVGPMLQPTVLVHDLFLRLSKPDSERGGAVNSWTDREHFMASAAMTLRRMLVDHARRRRLEPREGLGAGEEAIKLADPTRSIAGNFDILAVDKAVTDLEQVDPVAAQIVQLRFFGGLSVEDTARLMGISVRSAAREWRFARAWLANRLGEATSRKE